MPEAKEHSGHTRPCIDHALHEDPTETTLLPLPDSPAEEDADSDATQTALSTADALSGS